MAAATGVSTKALIGARHRPNSTPASMALASEPGIAATARPSGLMRPAATNSPLARMKAPTAAGQPPSMAPVAASSAAPGVDHAPETG